MKMVTISTILFIVAAGVCVTAFLYLRQQWVVEPVPPASPIYTNDLLSRRLARFEPERGMTQADPQHIDGHVWRYFPFHVGGERYRLVLVFEGERLAMWEWASP